MVGDHRVAFRLVVEAPYDVKQEISKAIADGEDLHAGVGTTYKNGQLVKVPKV